ncbi:hypothetical protein PV433_10455 [Paenibacillus sp. GYB004]|uniref:hypothetical protein n=1 Tax=Paenibacillus sp. GYB004 TaxID=2994393 RepID=UPI002F96E2CE
MSDKKNGRDRIIFRLRKILDADLRQAIVGLSDGELSDKARDGLRWALGIRTTKRIEVKESPLTPQDLPLSSSGVVVRSKPTVFMPNQKR